MVLLLVELHSFWPLRHQAIAVEVAVDQHNLTLIKLNKPLGQQK